MFIDGSDASDRGYEFCYDLLDTSGKNNTVFLICGDRSQNVNENIAKELRPGRRPLGQICRATWGAVAIETNYRNSKPINEWINRFADAATLLQRLTQQLIMRTSCSFEVGRFAMACPRQYMSSTVLGRRSMS